MSNHEIELEGLGQPGTKYTRTSPDTRTMQGAPSATMASDEGGLSIEPHGIGENPEILDFDNSLDRWADYFEIIQEFSDLYSKRLLSGESVDNWFCDPLFSIKAVLSELLLICRILRSSPCKCGERLWQNTHCQANPR